jgi:hypothetical protein
MLFRKGQFGKDYPYPSSQSLAMAAIGFRWEEIAIKFSP